MSDAAAIPHDMEPHPLTGMYNGKFGLWLFLASEVMLFAALFSTYVLLRVEAPPGTWPKHGAEILNVPMAMFNTFVLITSSVTMVMAWASLKMNKIGKAQMFLTVTFLLAGTFLVVKYFEYSAKFSHFQVDLNAPMTIDGESVTHVRGHLDESSPKLERNQINGGFVTPDYVVIHPDEPAARPGADEHHAAKGEAKAAGHEHSLKIEKANIRRVTDFGPKHSTFLATYFTMTGLHGLHIVGGMVVILYFMLTGTAFWKHNPEKYANRIECTGLYWHFVDLVWIFLFPVLYLL